MPNFTAVWFDLDGTLIDSAHDLIPAIMQTIADAQLPCADFDCIRAQISRGSRQMIQTAVLAPLDETQLDDLVKKFHHTYLQRRLLNRYFDGMEDLLTRLENAHIAWGIITNKNTAFAQKFVEQANLAHRLSALVCGDTLPRNKPHPDPMLYACAHINAAPSNCLFVGDSRSDIEAAHAAGMPAVACAWGYLPPDDDINTWQADYLIENTAQLAEIIGI